MTETMTSRFQIDVIADSLDGELRPSFKPDGHFGTLDVTSATHGHVLHLSAETFSVKVIQESVYVKL